MQGPIFNGDERLSARYDYPEEWAAFSRNHQEFLKRFGNIVNAIDAAFQRIQKKHNSTGKDDLFLGALDCRRFYGNSAASNFSRVFNSLRGVNASSQNPAYRLGRH